MKKSMKKIISMGLVAAMSVSLVACGAKTPTSTPEDTKTEETKTEDVKTEEPASTEKPKEVVTLSLLMFTDWWNNGGWEDVINDFNAKSAETGVKIEVEKVAGGDQGNQIIKSRYAAGEMPDLQLYHNVNSALIELGKENFVDIGGEWVNNYDAEIINSKACSSEGVVYGAPFGSVNVDGMYYNKKAFEKAGVEIPNNWDELLTACEKLKAAGITPVYYSGKDSWTLQMIGHDAFEREAKDGKSMNEVMEEINTNKAKYADQDLFVDGLAKMKELVDKGYVNETYLSDTYDNAQEALANGTAAMYPAATWLSSELVKKFPDQLNDLGAFPMPFDGNDIVPTWGPRTLLVTKTAKNHEAAQIFVDYLGSKEGQQVFFQNISGVPLMKGITSNSTPPEVDLARYADERGKVLVWSDMKLYDFGAYDKYCQDLLVGAKTPLEVAQEMDKETLKNAKAKGDTNFQ